MKKIFTLLIGCLILSNLAFSTAGPVTKAGTLTVCNTGPVNVPVTVTDFNDVGGISLTLNYDAAILQYQGVILNPAISGSLTNGATSGVFLLSYTCDPGINLVDNTTLFTLNFSYIGPPAGGFSTITWPETPPEANEYSTADGTPYDKDPFGNYFINGSVTVDPDICPPLTGPVTAAPGISITCPPPTIAVPISVSNFNNVGGISLTLNYNAAILQYQGVILNAAIATSITNGSNPGIFILSFTTDPGINLTDDDILFTLNFGYVGPPTGGSSPISWAATPPEANEYSTPDGTPYNKDPFGSYFIDGNVTVSPVGCGGPITTIPVISACPSSSIAVPVTVTNFINVGAISLTLNYNAAVLQYQGVTLNPAIVTGSNYNANNPGVFVLGYFNLTGINLNDNDILFTLYFKSCSSGVSSLTWDPAQGANEYASPDGSVYLNTPFGFYFINGTVNVSDVNPPLITCPADIIQANDPGLCSAVVTWMPESTVVLNYGQNAMSTCHHLWQSFTATSTGVLTQVELFPNQNNFGPWNVTIYDGEGETECVLYNNPAFTPSGNPINFPVPRSVGVYVVSGQRYTISIVGPCDPVSCTAYCVDLWETWNNGAVVYPDGLYWDNLSMANPVLCGAIPYPGGATNQVALHANFYIDQMVLPFAATDDCDVKYVVCSPENGSLFGIGTTPVTATATDYGTNSASCSFNVTVNETEAPVITTCAPPQSAFAGVTCQAAVPDFTATTVATDNCGPVVITQFPTAGTLVGPGVTNVTITATDGVLLTATCGTTFTVTDNTPPVITTCAPPQSAFAGSTCQAAVPDFTATTVASDNCGPVVISQLPLAGTLVGPGVTNVTITATDGALLTATCGTTFTVTDNTPPVITTCAPPQSAFADGTCQAAVPDFTATTVASDNCGPVVITQFPTAGTLVGSGVTNVTITATDGVLLTATCGTTFTVTDNTPPVITTCAPAQSAFAGVTCQAAVPDFTATTVATDNCGPVVISQLPLAGTLVGPGVTNVTITATDGALLTATCGTTFTVTDNTPPVITACAPAQSAFADALCQAAVPDFTATTVASDNCGPVVITQFPTAGTLVGSGVTNVTITATDGVLLTATCGTTFTVTDNTPPVITTCAPAQSAFADALCQAAVPDFTATTVATDNCGPVVISQLPLAGTPVGLGVTNVTITAKDGALLTATCGTTFTVTDNTPPVITTCAPAQSAFADALCQAAVPDFTATTVASDNCGAVVISQLPLAGTPVGLGVTNVTITATDGALLTATCGTTFTVTDNTPPVITTCAPAQSAFADALCQAAVPDFTATTVASDNCGPVVISQLPLAGTPVGLGVTNVTITATDGALLTATCSTSFTVQLATITGTLKYNNLANTPMNNVTLMLNPGGATSITDASGNYSFGSLCGGTYTITVTNNNKPVTGINSSDAAQVNFWNAFSFPIEHVRFLAGDATDNFNDNATDALAIQYYFVYGTPLQRTLNSGTPWVYWKAGDMILSNFDPNCTLPSIQVIVNGNQIVPLFGQANGEFNMSFTPGGLKSASSTLQLIAGETRQLGTNMEIDLPVYIKDPSIMGAASIILNFPPDLADVMGVTMKENEGRLDWAVSGNELRIGWNSLLPLEFGAGEMLFNIRLRTTAEFNQGDEIRFTLASDPLNELADGSFNVIPDAVLGIDVLEFSTNGLWNPEPGTWNNLTLENHPNPFATYTALTYNLPAEGHVTLQVSDMTGRKVSMLVDEYQASGKYTLKLDALPLQPGIYTATLTLHSSSGDMIRTVKLVRSW